MRSCMITLALVISGNPVPPLHKHWRSAVGGAAVSKASCDIILDVKKPQSLHDLIPDADLLLNLEPEELGMKIIQHLKSTFGEDRFWIGSIASSWTAGDRVGSPHLQHLRHGAAEKAVEEALAWLKAQGLIIHDPSQSGEFYVLSRRAKRFQSPGDFSIFLLTRSIHKELLNPRIADQSCVDAPDSRGIRPCRA